MVVVNDYFQPSIVCISFIIQVAFKNLINKALRESYSSDYLVGTISSGF